MFYGWLAKKFGKVVAWLIIIGLILAVAVGGYMTVKRFFTANLKTEVKLNKNLGKAAMESGSDAVDTVSNRAAAEQNQLGAAQETKDEIAKQTDAGSVTRVGRRGLCDGRPNRRGCGGVQRPPAE